MKWNEIAESKQLRAMLKVYGIPVDGQTFLLVPIENNVVQLVHGGNDMFGSGMVVCEYVLEGGETVEELKKCLEPLLDGGRIMAPMTMS